MENKKAYDYPEIKVISLHGTDVLSTSTDPAAGDVPWQGEGGAEQYDQYIEEKSFNRSIGILVCVNGICWLQRNS